jgi:hypothetical protein
VRLLRRGDHAAKAGWASHQTRGAKLLAELDNPVLAFNGIGAEQLAFARDWVERVVARPPETVGSVLMLLVRRAGDRGWAWWDRQQAAELARHRYQVAAEDALLAARTALRAPDDCTPGSCCGWSPACCVAPPGRSLVTTQRSPRSASCWTPWTAGGSCRPMTAALCGPGW